MFVLFLFILYLLCSNILFFYLIRPQSSRAKLQRREETSEAREKKTCLHPAGRYIKQSFLDTPAARDQASSYEGHSHHIQSFWDTPTTWDLTSGYERERAATSRASETPQESETRLLVMRERTATSRASETVQQHQTWLQQHQRNKSHATAHLWREKQNAAFAYNPNLDYRNDPACMT